MNKTIHAVPDHLLQSIARACHEANRAYCQALGDHSQVNYEHAPDWQKTSAQNGVIGILCHGNTPEQSHASWLEEKRRSGWVFGEVKNPAATPPTHPCMVEYSALPAEQQAKDHLFRDVCVAMARAFGLPV